MGVKPFRITGEVRKNAGAFSVRIKAFKAKFVEATGIPDLHEGTLNVWAEECVAIWPQFMIEGSDLDKPNEDYLFENCKVIVDGKEYDGFRVRPYHRPDGGGGNGDKCMEIIAGTIPGVKLGMSVTLEFARDSRP